MKGSPPLHRATPHLRRWRDYSICGELTDFDERTIYALVILGADDNEHVVREPNLEQSVDLASISLVGDIKA